MKNTVLIIWMILTLACGAALAQTTDFTFQGSLKNGANPASGNYDFEFALFDAAAAGTQVGTTVSANGVAVTNGIFSVKLNFGANFPGANRFLEIRVRQTGGGAFTPLTPRQAMTSTPYSVKSLTADNATNAVNATTANTATTATNSLQLGGVAASQFVQSDAAVINAATQFNIGGSRVLSIAGTENIFVGVGAGAANTSGSSNSFFGSAAGSSNTTGNSNSFFGRLAGTANTSGNFNSFFGIGAGWSNMTGDRNSFFGYFAGERNTTGFANSFFGNLAGQRNTTGVGNNFVGYQAGQLHTTGSNNTFIGANSGLSNTIENNNIFIGNNANGAAGITNATAIGVFSSVQQSNSLVLGSINGINGASADTNVGIGLTAPTQKLHVVGNGVFIGNLGVGTTTPTFALDVVASSNAGLRVLTSIAGGTVASFAANGDFKIDSPNIGGGRFTVLENGNVGIGNITPTDKLNVNGNVSFFLASGGATQVCQNASLQIATCSSSIRYKQNINPFNQGLSLIKQLRPVSFNWRANNQADLGLVAEDVKAVVSLVTTTNEKGEVEGVKYDRVGVVLVNAVNEQQAQIEAQQKQIDQQTKQIESLTKIVCAINPKAEICPK